MPVLTNNTYYIMEKFARKCSVTGQGMNDGYVFNDGEMYFKNEEDLIVFLRSREDNNDLSDDFLLKEAYDQEEYYYTEWDEIDEDEWYDAEGNEFNS
jgi:hypothetical protein